MAERVIAIQMTLNADQAVDELNKVEQETASINEQLVDIEDNLRDLSKEAAKGEAAKSFAELNKVLDKNVLSIQDLGVAADNFKNIALAAGTTSPIGQQALKRAAEMENQMDQLNRSVASLAEGGRALNASLEIGTGVVAGFTAFQGVTALLGEENEDLQETIVKVQSAQAVLMGVTELKVALDRRGIIVTTAQAVANRTLAITQRILNVVMSANPVFLIIAGIALLVAGFVFLKDSITETIQSFGVLKTVILVLLGPIGLLIFAYEKLFGTLKENTEDQEKLLRENSEREAKRHTERIKRIEEERDAKIAASNETIKALELEIDTLEAEGRASDEATVQILEAELAKVTAVLDANQEKIQSWITYYENLAALRGEDEEAFRQSLKNQGIDLELLQQQANDLLAENERNIQFAENRITKFRRERREMEAAEFQKHQDELNRIKEEAVKKQLELEAILAAGIAKLEDLRIGNIKNQDERELALLKLKQKREREAIEERFGLNGELEKELLLKQADELDALQQAIDDRRVEATKEFYALIAEARAANAEQEQVEQEERQAQIDTAFENLQKGLEVAQEINEILDELGNRRQETISENRDKALKDSEKNRKNVLANESLTANQRVQIEQQFALQDFSIKKKAAEAADKIAKQQFNRNKALKLAEITINTAAGIAQALGSLPPPASFITAGITGAMGIAQAALVASTKFKGTAGAITPPSFSAANISAGGVDGTTDGVPGSAGGQQIDQGVNPQDLVNQQVVVSQVEINQEQNLLANVKEVSTIG